MSMRQAPTPGVSFADRGPAETIRTVRIEDNYVLCHFNLY
jgi:hypothetical protein